MTLMIELGMFANSKMLSLNRDSVAADEAFTHATFDESGRDTRGGLCRNHGIKDSRLRKVE
jgi:hypothetical protein